MNQHGAEAIFAPNYDSLSTGLGDATGPGSVSLQPEVSSVISKLLPTSSKTMRLEISDIKASFFGSKSKTYSNQRKIHMKLRTESRASEIIVHL